MFRLSDIEALGKTHVLTSVSVTLLDLTCAAGLTSLNLLVAVRCCLKVFGWWSVPH